MNDRGEPTGGWCLVPRSPDIAPTADAITFNFVPVREPLLKTLLDARPQLTQCVTEVLEAAQPAGESVKLASTAGESSVPVELVLRGTGTASTPASKTITSLAMLASALNNLAELLDKIWADAPGRQCRALAAILLDNAGARGAPDLVRYVQGVIHRAAFTGEPIDRIDRSTWPQAMVAAHPAVTYAQPGRNLSFRGAGAARSPSSERCRAFNKGRACARSPCDYTHTCSACGSADHGAHECGSSSAHAASSSGPPASAPTARPLARAAATARGGAAKRGKARAHFPSAAADASAAQPGGGASQ